MKTYNGEFLTRPELEALGVICAGDNVRIHTSVVIINLEALRVGNHVRIDPFCLLSASGKIALGDHIHIAAHCSLIGAAGIELEDFTGVSHGARLFSAADDMSGTYLTGPTAPNELRNVQSGPIKLKRHAVVGTNAVIFPGVTIGEGAIIGALSLSEKMFRPGKFGLASRPNELGSARTMCSRSRHCFGECPRFITSVGKSDGPVLLIVRVMEAPRQGRVLA